MRITFTTSNVETLEYLKTITMVLRNNRSVEEDVKAYQALKELVVSLDNRLDKLEASVRRNKVCRP